MANKKILKIDIISDIISEIPIETTKKHYWIPPNS